MRRAARAALPILVAGVALVSCGGGNSPPPGAANVPGAERTPTTTALETAADVVQAKAPIDAIAMYMVGFHPSKADPGMQVESHHYCNQMNEDVAQCVLFDGNTAAARLHGIEFIVSARVYDALAEDERVYWHPHNYEILSGQLRMPGVPAAAEDAALVRKINSYGKTWHVWQTGVFGRDGDALPLGPPQLAWSFNRDGEAVPGLVEARDARMGLDTAAARAARAGWATQARPQGGVAVLEGRLPSARGAPAGVADDGRGQGRGVPVVTLTPR